MNKKTRNDLFYALALAGKSLAVSPLPRFTGLALFGGLGVLACRLARKDRNLAIDHLRMVYGSAWDERKIRAVARDVFVNLGKNLYDAVRFTGLEQKQFGRLVSVENYDSFVNAAQSGSGVIAITAHLGCYEGQLSYFARNGVRAFAIGRTLYDPRLDRLVSKARSGENMEYVHRGESPRTILRLLRQGKVFAVLTDQDTSVEGVFADFMGRPAYTPSGPVKMAMRYGFPLYVATTARMPGSTHRIWMNGPVKLESTANEQRDLVMNVQKTNDIICAKINEFPGQWVWMHKRWNRKKTDPGMEKTGTIEEYRSQIRGSQGSGARSQ